MCMGCMANSDFLLTSGILGAASVRVGLRRYLPGLPTWPRKVTDDEASEFVASLTPAAPGAPVADMDAPGSTTRAEATCVARGTAPTAATTRSPATRSNELSVSGPDDAVSRVTTPDVDATADAPRPAPDSGSAPADRADDQVLAGH